MTLKPYPHIYPNVSAVPLGEFQARWPNFHPSEIACRGTGKVAFNFEAMDKLQALRVRRNRPLILNSAFRSAEHNRAVEGAPGSKHLTAEAFDVSMSNHNPDEYEEDAKAVGFTGFGFYPRSNFIHADIGPARSWGSRFPKTVTGLPTENKAAPEALKEDKSAVAALVGGGGSVAGAGVMVSSLGALSPTAQVIAVVAFVIGLGAMAYIFRRRLKALSE
ncbi:peptidase [Rhodobacter phage RcTitan]|uniref:Peptidase n=1 Tax=Rhodobacter phage RcTitan TaxID=1662330 RepID=A0A0K1LKR7_9CAUD|nr:peptidase [Rhodobacter phage RcTitan]AKU43019.1 peptidase [Rhodobacter phage RcTitan]UUV44512.1 peptidase [Rhodobacter phage RcMotherGoose]